MNASESKPAQATRLTRGKRKSQRAILTEMLAQGLSPAEIKLALNTKSNYVYRQTDGNATPLTKSYLEDALKPSFRYEWERAVERCKRSGYDLSKIRLVKEH